MNENKEGEVSVLNDPDGVEDGKLQIEAINKALDELYAQLTQSKLESSKIFEKLLRKFDQLQANETDPRTRCRQSILLCGELVDGITEATDTDVNDFRGCLRLLYRLISDFESSARIENNNLFAREIFFALLDILTGTKICSYLNENPRVKISNKEFYRMLTDVLLTIAASTVRNTLFTSADISTRKYTEIFQIMYKRVNRDLDLIAKTDNRLSDDSQTTSCILSFFWSFSNHTVIVPWLLNIGLIEVMLKCLQITKISQTICQLINIIHNISRHDDGTDELNQFNGLQILKDVQNNTTQKLDDFNNLVISMVIAQLSTVEQIRSDNKRMNRILNQLLQMTIDASKTENHLNEKGFHVSEFLAVFTRLFVDDRSLEYVLNHAETDPQLKVSTTIGLFVDLLIDFQNIIRTKDHLKEFTCTALVNILWSISFHDRYKTKLKQNDKLLKTLRNLDTDKSAKTIDQYVPRSMESINKAASGILYNLNDILDEKKSIDPGVQLVANTNNEKPMIMISYAHDNDSFCDKILEILEKKHNLYRIWIDRNHCSSSDDLWEKISRGIGQSRLVVCLLSEEYFNSKSCRKEAALAVKRKKPIVPIYLGNPGDCDWLDIHIADRKYIRFNSNKCELDRDKVREMLRTIEATIEESQGQTLQSQQTEQHSIPASPQRKPEKINSTTFDVQKSLEEWTQDDIQKWFQSHNVPDTLVKLFDFQSITEMNQYASKLQVDPKNEFLKYRQRYAKQYAGDELEEYVFDRFKNALLKLPSNQSETKKLSMSTPKTSSSSKSTTCIIL